MLDTPIEYLKGVGPPRAEVLKKELGIFLYRDLLTHYPFRYVDRTRFYTIREITEELGQVQIKGTVQSLEIVGQKQAKRLVVLFRDKTGLLELVWFQGHQWMAQKLQAGAEYIVFGKASVFNGRMNMAHPEIEPVNTETQQAPSAFQPVYNSTEKLKFKGLDSEGLVEIGAALDACGGPDVASAWLPAFGVLAAGILLGPLALAWSRR